MPRILLPLLLILAIPAAAFTKPTIDTAYGHIPLAFTLNEGQAHSSIRFTAQGSGCAMAFSPTGTTFLLSRETSASVAKRAAKRSVVFEDDPTRNQPEFESFALKLAFVGANENPEIQGEDRLPWNNNYFIGNDASKWRTDVPNYGKIRLTEVYDGIDLVYYGNQKRVKYDFVVKPGEDPNRILLKYDFGDSGGSLAVNEKGELVVKTPLGELIEEKPYCYQKVNGKDVEVEVGYEVVEGGTYRFRVGAYDGRYDLVIDPELVYLAMIDSGGSNGVRNMTVDSQGNVYIAGMTQLNSSDYPVTPGAYDESFNGLSDTFVSKLNASGSALEYSTFIGGAMIDDVSGISVDSSGNVYIGGATNSTDYPVTEGSFGTSFNGGMDITVTALNAEGNSLEYSTYIGGVRNDSLGSLLVDDQGYVYFTGATSSPDYPVTPDAFDNVLSGDYDALVTVMDPWRNSIEYSTYIGGGKPEHGNDIALDAGGNVYMVGYTESPDFPVTSGAFDGQFNGMVDVIIVKLNLARSRLEYSTYLGGSDNDFGLAIGVDREGCAYVVGKETSLEFPVTPNAFQPTRITAGDSFIAKLNPQGSGLVYSSLFSGFVDGIALDMMGNAFITGMTRSGDFPVTPRAFDESFDGGSDAFLSMIDTSGTKINYSTFIGGAGSDAGTAVTVASDGAVYVTGKSQAVPGVTDSTFHGEGGLYVIKFIFKDGETGTEDSTPLSFRLSAPHPNPFNPSTTITFSLPSPAPVTLAIYSVTGQKVATLLSGPQAAGSHAVRWDASGFASGVYFCRLEADGRAVTGKLTLVK